jgi:phosphoserine phosphatase RsbU/P
MVDDAPHTISRPLKDGSLLLLLTDGISDARNQKQERFGEQRVFEIIRRNRKESVETMVEKVFDSLRRFTGGVAQRDDQTLLILRL